jgi:hypothetical protein
VIYLLTLVLKHATNLIQQRWQTLYETDLLMTGLNKLTSKIQYEIEIFVDELQNEKPEKGYSFLTNETNTLWTVNWKSTKYLKEYYELEIWKENIKYSIMGSYIIEDLYEHLNTELVFYEKKKPKELWIKIDKILDEFKKGINESSKL